MTAGQIPVFEPDEKGDFRWRYRWEPTLRSDGALEINKYINDTLSEVLRIEEEALTGAAVVALRAKGYTVIEPEER